MGNLYLPIPNLTNKTTRKWGIQMKKFSPTHCSHQCTFVQKSQYLDWPNKLANKKEVTFLVTWIYLTRLHFWKQRVLHQKAISICISTLISCLIMETFWSANVLTCGACEMKLARARWGSRLVGHQIRLLLCTWCCLVECKEQPMKVTFVLSLQIWDEN